MPLAKQPPAQEPLFPYQSRLGIIAIPVSTVVGVGPLGSMRCYKECIAALEECVVLSATTDAERDVVLYLVAHPALPVVPPDETAPEYEVVLYAYRDGRVRRLSFQHRQTGKEFLTTNG